MPSDTPGKDELNYQLAVEESSGIHSRADLEAAYNMFPGVTTEEVQEFMIDDFSDFPADRIVTAFQSKLQSISVDSSLGVDGKVQAKKICFEALRVITDSRRSLPVDVQMLEAARQAAEKEPLTPEAAYARLEVTPDMDDDFIMTYVTSALKTARPSLTLNAASTRFEWVEQISCLPKRSAYKTALSPPWSDLGRSGENLRLERRSPRDRPRQEQRRVAIARRPRPAAWVLIFFVGC